MQRGKRSCNVMISCRMLPQIASLKGTADGNYNLFTAGDANARNSRIR